MSTSHAGDRSRGRLSLVVPAYNEAEGAAAFIHFWSEIRRVLPEFEVELVLVDDGSTDGTAEEWSRRAVDGDVVVVSLSRNFGSHAAITAGFEVCTGDAAITLSAELQEPLSAVLDFVHEWQDGGDVVWGLRTTRASMGKAAVGAATGFSAFFAAHSDVPTYPAEGPSQVLVDRRVIDVLNAMPEANRNIMAMIAWVGFEQRRIHFEQLPRPYGVSRWTRSRKTKLVVDSFVGFSAEPIRLIMMTGLSFVALGVILLLVGALTALAAPSFPAGFTVMAGLIVGLGGGILGAIGMVGEYVWRAGSDARGRPTYVVSGIHRGRESGDR